MSGRVIAITGASSGIGAATARLLARAGARLVLGARRLDKLEGVARDIIDAGGTALAQPLDVTSRGSMDAFVAETVARFGRIDVLIANAGLMTRAPLAEARRDDWDAMIDVNIKGVLNGIAAALPVMMAQGDGHMVLVGSISGRRVMPSSGVYAATKFAVRALAESIRVEGGTAIRSTLIQPGATASGMVVGGSAAGNTDSMADLLLPVDAVARAIAYAIDQPREVDVSEVIVRPLHLRP